MSALLVRIAAVALVITSAAFAHDRHGNAAMHQDVRVLIAKDHVEVTFQIETNEEGTMVEAIAMDANGDGKLSPEEQSVYFAQLDARLREGLQISVHGRDVPLVPSGQVDLAPPARKTFHFRGPIDLKAFPASIEIHNDNFMDWPGRVAMAVDAGDGLALRWIHRSDSVATVSVLNAENYITDLWLRRFDSAFDPKVNWSEWSVASIIMRPPYVATAALLLLAFSALMMLGGRKRPGRTITCVSSLVASLALAFVATQSRGTPVVPSKAWEAEFRSFHAKLSAALASYHQGGDASLLGPFASDEAIKKLADATRVMGPHDEKSGAWELRRTRIISTTVSGAPEGLFHPIMIIHHEWRAIGLMRHQGHPHERIRDFSCDYTLRVTEHGFELLDCSDWHQLPDEPLE